MKGNGGPDNGTQVGWVCMILGGHRVQHMANDALLGAPPASMYCGSGLMDGIIEEHRDTIGSGDTDTDPGLIGRQSVHTLKEGSTLGGRTAQQLRIDNPCLRTMHLMGDQYLIHLHSQGSRQPTAVLGDMFCRITTLGIDIHRGIGTLAHAARTHGAESKDTFAKGVTGQGNVRVLVKRSNRHTRSRPKARCRPRPPQQPPPHQTPHHCNPRR